MAEDREASRPQVFVVDSQASPFAPPARSRPTWTRALRRRLVLSLVLLCLLGLAVEGYFICELSRRTEELNHVPPAAQTSNEIRLAESYDDLSVQKTEAPQTNPVAHLMGAASPAGDVNVIQWISEGDRTIMRHMTYRDGRLVLERDGVYHIYTKVQLNAAEECFPIEHKVLKKSQNYGLPIELMTAMISRCPKPSERVPAGPAEDLRDSFLAGSFQLKSGDEIYVTLESIKKLRPGHTHNYLGAFMIGGVL